MEPEDVVLSHRRVGTSYEGDIDGEAFSDCSFSAMMLMVHARLFNRPGCGLRIVRTERQGLFPVQLEPALLRMLREDPLQYIQRHTMPDRVADLRPPDRISKLAAPYRAPRGGLRAGHATLADAFGDYVYVRLRAGRVENPCTGRWSPIPEMEDNSGITVHQAVLTDEKAKSGWLVIATTKLLQSAAPRFYLPREWNESGSWITKERLQEMYDQFRKDRDSCP
jgi:hypothetical protein